MSFIGGIAFERKTFSGSEYIRIGQLWYNRADHHCSLMMYGLRMGQLMCKPYPKHINAELPYLKGDIKIQTGEYQGEHSMVKDYMWCGWIWTESNQEGHIYQIRLEVDPSPVLMQRVLHEGGQGKNGVFLSVHLEDKPERKEQEPEEDNLPF